MNEELFREYERLLLERDTKEKEAGSLRTAYIKEFGELINKSFEMKLECIKKKKSVAFCQMYVNHGKKVNVTELQRYLDHEMSEYNEKLKGMLSDYEWCKQAEVATELTVLKAKTLYRKLAKKIHPDMNPMTAGNKELLELWGRIVEAYHMNDAEKLKELEVLVYAVLDEVDIADGIPEIENIEEKIQALKDEIERIITTDPYQYSLLLDDEDAVIQKKQELQKEIDEYTRYARELDEVLQGLMRNGVVMIWQAN